MTDDGGALLMLPLIYGTYLFTRYMRGNAPWPSSWIASSCCYGAATVWLTLAVLLTQNKVLLLPAVAFAVWLGWKPSATVAPEAEQQRARPRAQLRAQPPAREQQSGDGWLWWAAKLIGSACLVALSCAYQLVVAASHAASEYLAERAAQAAQVKDDADRGARQARPRGVQHRQPHAHRQGGQGAQGSAGRAPELRRRPSRPAAQPRENAAAQRLRVARERKDAEAVDQRVAQEVAACSTVRLVSGGSCPKKLPTRTIFARGDRVGYVLPGGRIAEATIVARDEQSMLLWRAGIADTVDYTVQVDGEQEARDTVLSRLIMR